MPGPVTKPDVSGLSLQNRTQLGVAGLLCIHVFTDWHQEDVDGRDMPGHEEESSTELQIR
jgi:hypothetical protein